MNALMRVQIRVVNETARELARVQKDLERVTSSAQRMGRAGGEASRFMRGPDLIRFGKDLQWTGRQIEYNFTLPLIAAGRAGFKMLMDQEKALTRLQKVYGDVGSTGQEFARDQALLRRAARALSDTFGIQQDQILEIMATWAAAGAEGYALAKATETTMQAMILGELEAADATKALITVQQGYKLSSNQLTVVLAQLNAVENETAANLGELIDGFQRVAGTAYAAGVSTGDLAAMIAALVPAAGSGTQAGNALKTIFSRLAAPTKEAADLMRRMGLEIESTTWLSASATDRLEMMAESFNNLTDAQKQVASAYISGRYQISRFDLLMRALTDSTSQYAIAQKAVGEGAEGQQRAIQQMNNELLIFLRSSPQALQILRTRLMNLLTEAITPLVPAIIGFLTAVTRLAEMFSRLPPEVQMMVISGLGFLALLGPLIRYFGAFTTLIGIGRVTILRAGQALGFFTRTITHLDGSVSVMRRGFAQLVGLFARLSFAPIGMSFDLLARGIRIASYNLWQVVPAIWTRGISLLGGITVAGARFAIGAFLVNFNLLVGTASIVLSRMGAAFTRGFVALRVIALGGGRMVVSAMIEGLAALTIGVRALLGRAALAAAAGFRALPALIGRAMASIGPMLVRFGPMVLRFLTGPIGLAVTTVATLMVVFRKQIGEAIRWVIDAFGQLPRGISNAFMAVVRIVKAAVMAVYNLLSYLNPFARHSPSLVEQVRAGVDLISSLYAGLGNVGENFRSAIDDLNAFKDATAGMMEAMEAAEFNEARAIAVSMDPSAGPAIDRLRSSMRMLEGDLAAVGIEFARQVEVVRQWEAELDAANQTLDAAQQRLNDLSAAADRARDELDAAKQALDDLSRTPIQGMREMEDAIFGNEMAQKRLRLEMMRWEDIHGSIDDARSSLAAMAGEIEMLQGEQASLREAGAGGDILGFYDDQIAGIQAQGKAIEDSFSEYDRMESEMENLRRQGEMLELQNSITFDPLLRQIDQTVNAMQEMPFDELIGKIQQQQGEVARLTAVWDQADAAVREQQGVVDALTERRDMIQAIYDTEQANLDRIGQAYDLLEAQIRDMESAMFDFLSASNQAAEAAGRGNAAELFDAAAMGGDIPDPNAGLPADMGGGDLEKLVEDMEKRSREMFGKLDIRGWLKEKFDQAKQWLREEVGPFLEPIIGAVQGAVEAIRNFDFGALDIDLPEGLVSFLELLWSFVRDLWPAVSEFLTNLGGAMMDAGRDIFNELANWGPTISGVIDAVKVIIETLLPIFAIVIGAIKLIWEVGFGILGNIVGPIFRGIGETIRAALEVIRGIIDVITGIITGDWKRVWTGILTIVDGVWDGIFGIFRGVWNILRGIVSGIVEGIVGFFQWLYDVLIGHSIIPDLVHGIIDFFNMLLTPIRIVWEAIGAIIKWAWENVIKPAWDALVLFWEEVLAPLLDTMLEVFETIWNAIGEAVKWAWENIIMPVWEAIQAVWESFLSPLLDRMLEGFKNIWNAIGTAVKWVWENVIMRVWDAIMFYWNTVFKPVIEIMQTVFETVWNGISTGISGAWDVIRGIFDAIIGFVQGPLTTIWDTLKGVIVGAFEGVRDLMGGIWDGIVGAIRSGVNLGIGVLNAIIDGVQAIANVIPGVNINLPNIPELGRGGASMGGNFGTGPGAELYAMGGYDLGKRGPFKTDGARAIVGEGNRSYPEFVIPTDPKWRSRALGLFGMLANSLGLGGQAGPGGVPMFGWGGLPSPGDIVGALRDAWDATGGKVVSAVREGAVMAAFAPFLAIADRIIAMIPWDMIREMANKVKNDVYNWAKGADSSANEELARQRQAVNDRARAEAFAKPTNLVPKGWGDRYRSGWSGGGLAMGGLPHLYKGALVRGSLHGTAVVAGDRNRTEAIVPLPDAEDFGKKEFHFYGDLEFPNITDGNDAEEFIRNLESLVD